MMTCKNCGSAFEGNFCNNCGQKARTERLDWRYLSDEAKYTFLHFNGGLAYTVKELATRPGHAIRDFVDGKRIKHYKPLLLLFVLAGSYGLLMHYADLSPFFESMQTDLKSKKAQLILQMQNEVYQWMVGHYSLLEIIILPLLSLASWIGFRGWGYNLIEHVIFNTYSASLRLMYYIAIFPVLYFTTDQSYAVFLHGLFSLPAYGLSVWCYFQFYKGREVGHLIVRLIITAILSIIFVGVFAMVTIMIYLFANKEKFIALAGQS